MPIPPKGDPDRPLGLAVNAARTMGGISIAVGLMAGCFIFADLGEAPPGFRATIWILGFIMAGLCLVPGVLYFVFASRLRAYKGWAAVVLLVMASLQTLLLALNLARGLLQLAASKESSAGDVVLIFIVIFFLVGVLLIVYLSKSFTAIRLYQNQNAGHAFQPIMRPSPYAGPYARQYQGHHQSPPTPPAAQAPPPAAQAPPPADQQRP